MSNPDDRSADVWAVAILFLVLTWVTVGLRLYVRLRTLSSFGLDDQTLIAAQILFTAYLACQIGGVVYGTGKRLSILTPGDAETALRFWFFCEVWYALAAAMVKITICLSLRRVTTKFIHLLIIYGIMLWSAALGLAFFLGIIFQCIPASDWWDLDPAHKHCLASHITEALVYAISALNIACDWTLGVFPFFIVKDLSIPRRQKIVVGCILAFGAIGSTATCVRIAYLPSMREVYKGRDGDFLYETTPVAIWSTVESGIAITAMCLATLRPLVNKLFGLNSWGESYGGCSLRSGAPSPRSSAQCSSPLPFGGYPSSRAQAEAIVQGDDISPVSETRFSQAFNKTKSTRFFSREIEADELELGPVATVSAPKGHSA